MTPKITNVSTLTKETLHTLYFESLENPQTRKTHTMVLLSESRGGPTRITPSIHDAEIDVTCWYGPVITLAQALDPGVELPGLKEMVSFITQDFDKVKTAVAA